MSSMSPGTEENVPTHRYTARIAGELEARWQRSWTERGTFQAPNPAGPLAGPVPADKLFVQDMFPYPSGAGLHVGHPLGGSRPSRTSCAS
jgi:leucyl-tRNA synthetase